MKRFLQDRESGLLPTFLAISNWPSKLSFNTRLTLSDKFICPTSYGSKNTLGKNFCCQFSTSFAISIFIFFYIRSMKRVLFSGIFLIFYFSSFSQAPQSWASGQLFQAIKRLKVLGSVLYVAAHPDDENTRLITYLANEKLYRTGYLSLTRGDGGQNLIGDEQGVELGLIRTQELLAARRIDGGEQFFTSAYDFGYSKTPEETFAKWDKEKILSDVVWVIRNFQPDIIITRFPTTGEGGHGHHTASAILANEAFTAAADPNRFPEQLKHVKPWQAKRILWNTFNFGGNNTTSSSQFKIDAGGYNPLLGKGYGEIAALSRSQHKSQGFGSAASRGEMLEYFRTLNGPAPNTELMDEVNTTWGRLGNFGQGFEKKISAIEKSFDGAHPEKSVPALLELYNEFEKLPASYWRTRKLTELKQILSQASGLFIDTWTSQPFAVQTDSIKLNISINNRLGTPVTLKNITVDGWKKNEPVALEKNHNYNFSTTLYVPMDKKITQPFWLREKMEEGRFTITDPTLVGVPDVEPAYLAKITVSFSGKDCTYEQPLKYRRTDPVKGELYDPLYIIPRATLSTHPSVLLFDKNKVHTQKVLVQLHPNKDISGDLKVDLAGADVNEITDSAANLKKGITKSFEFKVSNRHAVGAVSLLTAYANQKVENDKAGYFLVLRSINYDHIPSIKYFYPELVKMVNLDLKTAGKKIGYIQGAGDKVTQVLEELGYEVVLLDAANLATLPLTGFDAIITGVRAYNTNDWLNAYYPKLMDYVKAGGNLIVQYNTSSNLGPLKAKIGPYDFTISRNRITDEHAKVTLLDPTHKVFNFPNKINDQDFDNWIQERSLYHAANWDNPYQPLLSMADPGEKPDIGSLIIGKYGKGYFTYTGLAFFRELPAAVPGAFRLMANLIALNQPEAPILPSQPLKRK